MATGMELLYCVSVRERRTARASRGTILLAMGVVLLFVVATRWPVARTAPIDSDEFGFLAQAAAYWFPMHHTLFMAAARVLGLICGDRYRGFVVLDIVTSTGES